MILSVPMLRTQNSGMSAHVAALEVGMSAFTAAVHARSSQATLRPFQLSAPEILGDLGYGPGLVRTNERLTQEGAHGFLQRGLALG